MLGAVPIVPKFILSKLIAAWHTTEPSPDPVPLPLSSNAADMAGDCGNYYYQFHHSFYRSLGSVIERWKIPGFNPKPFLYWVVKKNAKYLRRNLHARIPIYPYGFRAGAPSGYAHRVFKKAGVSPSNLHLDYQAIDTVTNFTTLVDRFESKGITSVYLVTSDDHIQRARTIGEIVFGSRGIKVKPVTFVSGRPAEPLRKTVRDGCRSLLWLTTGFAGSK